MRIASIVMNWVACVTVIMAVFRLAWLVMDIIYLKISKKNNGIKNIFLTKEELIKLKKLGDTKETNMYLLGELNFLINTIMLGITIFYLMDIVTSTVTVANKLINKDYSEAVMEPKILIITIIIILYELIDIKTKKGRKEHVRKYYDTGTRKND